MASSPTSADTLPHPAPFPIGGVEFVAMMAATMALQALAIDAMLPAPGRCRIALAGAAC